MKSNTDIHYDTVVVGGGIAGLTATAFLAKQGKNVLLCEKEKTVGGLVFGFNEQGFVFDGGIHALENAGTLLPMLKNLGIDAELKKSNVMLRIKDKTVTISDDNGLQSYEEMLQDLFCEHRQEISQIVKIIKETMDNMDVLYGEENPLFSQYWGQPVKLIKSMLPWIGGYLRTVAKINAARMTVRDRLFSVTNNTALVDVISQHFFADSPAFFALGYFWLYKDYYYPNGSILSLPQKMQNYITKKGGEVNCSTEVTKIDVKQNTITTKNAKTIGYKHLIWCGSEKSFNNAAGKQMKYNKSQRGGESVLSIYIAASISPQQVANICGSHMFFTPSIEGLSSITKPKEAANADELLHYTKKYLQLTSYEISCPAVNNAQLAPDGCSGLTITTLFDYDITRSIYNLGVYQKFKEVCVETIVNLLDQSLINGLFTSILFSRCATPLTIERTTGNDDGAITGWSYKSRPMPAVTGFTTIAKSIKTEYPDIYRAGMWTFSPAGLPVSIITGRLAADNIIFAQGKANRNTS